MLKNAMSATVPGPGCGTRVLSFLLILCATLNPGRLLADSIAGSNPVCAGGTNAFSIISVSTPIGYSWTISTNMANTASAVLLNVATNASVDVTATTAGVFTLECLVFFSATNELISTNIIVNSSATASALTNQSVCAGGSVTFTTVATGSGTLTYLWRKDSVALTNETTDTLVLTNVSASDEGTYCVEVSGPCNTVTNCATLDVIEPAIIICPSNLIVSCVSDVPAADTNLLSTTGAISVWHAGDSIYTNGCQLEIARTYAAINSCGVTSTCLQTITVADTTPPIIACGTNHTVECGDAWNFDPPAASDVCSGTNVTITIVDTYTNQLVGETYSATRIWMAMDLCSNTTTCTQTVTLVDNTPPQIFCPANLALECTGSTGTVATFTATAWDACDSNVTVVCTPPSGSLFALGTNTVLCSATDDSGNSNQCTFTVTIVDTTPPQITCPPDLIVSESPRDSGGAAVTFVLPTVLDTCDGAPQLISTPASGSILSNGITTVTWTAVDESGNSNSCTFTVRVIPYRLFVVTNTDDAGPGSLRQALLDGNDAPDENLIIFQLPGAGPYTIQLESALPPVMSPTIIDGWSISGSNNPPVVELDGGSNTFDGLVIRAGLSTVRGLALHGFATGIVLDGGGTNTIQGNFIGTDLTGTNAAGNSAHGILLTNQTAGNLIGGTQAGEGNLIVFNGQNGIALDLTAGTGNSILGNTINANGALGIDIGNNGVSPNDADDPDTGPNDFQNFPILSDARSVDGITTMDGTLTSAPNNTYRIEFFLNDVADPSTNGEGHVFMGSTLVAVHGSGSQSFSASFPVPAVFTQFVTATATDPFGNTSEFSPTVHVRTPPVIEVQPSSTNAPDGSTVTFCVGASGTSPLHYQWRLNGVNIPGATNECYTMPAASLGDGGTYTVIVGNVLGAFATATASLLLTDTNILNLAVGDNFADAVDISQYGNGTNGIVAGDNSLATFEPPFEPFHAGKPGGRSVWYRWCTPNGGKGIATFSTTGSTFDTLMGVYRGTSLSNLVEVASNEDGAGHYLSEVRFNAFYNLQPNSCYYIAVDGYGGDSGPLVLSWTEEKTSHMLPVILIQPTSQTVPLGASVVLTNFSVPECPNGHLDCNNPNHWFENYKTKEKLTYQWYFTNAPIPGATNSSFAIPAVQPTNAGDYRVRVFTEWQYLDSKTAVLQINNTGEGSQNAQAFDKFLDLDVFGNPLFIGTFTQNTAPPPPTEQQQLFATAAATTIVRGYTGTQIFNTAGSATAPTEVICGALGGSSEWISLVAEANGTLFLNTDGSTYDTVMAIFVRSPTNSSLLLQLGCDNDGGVDGRTSSITVPVEGGKTNYVLVDGVNGATGILQLNYSLATATILKIIGRTPEGANLVQVNGRAGLRFALQGSPNFGNWVSLVTTNATTDGTFIYTDTGSIGLPNRYYRALILP